MTSFNITLPLRIAAFIASQGAALLKTPVRVGPSILLPVFASLKMTIPPRFSGVCQPTSQKAR
jgi:hypothetical protein